MRSVYVDPEKRTAVAEGTIWVTGLDGIELLLLDQGSQESLMIPSCLKISLQFALMGMPESQLPEATTGSG